MNESRIAILVATYNGAVYLRAQLDSLMSQTRRDWTLYVQDDFSTDSTLDIIREYQQRYDNIRLLEHTSQLGPMKNFMSMLEQVEADYYLFCDQDDVWVADKVERSMQEMEACEAQNPGKPTVIFTDLRVVDSSLREISSSFWEYMKIYPEKLTTFARLGARRLATGCTMCFNRQAKNVSFPVSANAYMHDAWIVLSVAKHAGVIKGIPVPMVLYRQHESNVLGAVGSGLMKKFADLKNVGKENMKVYRMLKDLEYGSFLKYMCYKMITLVEAYL